MKANESKTCLKHGISIGSKYKISRKKKGYIKEIGHTKDDDILKDITTLLKKQLT